MVSGVWKYFTKNTNNTVKCNLCSKQLSHNTSSTGTMLNHLRIKHPTAKISAEADSGQPSISGMFSALEKKCDEKKAEKVTQLIQTFLVSNMLPFRIVESESFINLMGFCVPGYKVPSRVSFSKLTEKQYESKKTELKDELKAVNSISITTDSWTSVNTHSFTTVTGHFINNDWLLKSVVLATVHKKEDHTAENLRADIEEVLTDFGVQNKVTGCVHDNAANIVRGVRECQFIEISLNCAAHTLQLSVNKGLSLESINKAIVAASRLVGHFKHSCKASNYLFEKQVQLEMPQHKLLQKCTTRWNSTLDMLERLQEQRWAICAVLSDRRCTKLSDARVLELRDEYWRLFEELIPVLQPLKLATTAVSSENHISLSCVMPVMTALINNHLKVTDSDADTIKLFKSTILKDIKVTRFPELFSVPDDSENQTDTIELSPYIIASFLDPRHRHFPYLTEGQRRVILNSVVQMLEGFVIVREPDEDEVGVTEEEEDRGKLK